MVLSVPENVEMKKRRIRWFIWIACFELSADEFTDSLHFLIFSSRLLNFFGIFSGTVLVEEIEEVSMRMEDSCYTHKLLRPFIVWWEFIENILAEYQFWEEFSIIRVCISKKESTILLQTKTNFLKLLFKSQHFYGMSSTHSSSLFKRQ